MILALLLLSAIPFDTGTHPTSPYENDPLYIHAPTFPFDVAVAPSNAVEGKLTTTYTVSNAGIVIDNPYPYPIAAVDITVQFVTQYQALPGVQYPILGGIGTWRHETIFVDVPAYSTVTVPYYIGFYNTFDDCFGEDINACGGQTGVATGMAQFQVPTLGYEPALEFWFCPMAQVNIGTVAFVIDGSWRRYDFGWTVNDMIHLDADVQATGDLRWYDTNGVEL